MASKNRDLEELEILFRPAVIEVVREKLDELLFDFVPPERIRLWISIVKKQVKSFFLRRLILRVLRGKLRQAEKGENITLSKSERRELMKHASKRLPGYLADIWLRSLLQFARKNGNIIRLGSFDDSMIPIGMPPMEIGDIFEAFGAGQSELRDMLSRVHRELGGKTLPDPAMHWLNEHKVLLARN